MPPRPLLPPADPHAMFQRFSRAFTSWVAFRSRSKSRHRTLRPLSTDSALVYQEMWNAFAAFCVERSLELHEVDADDLYTFLTTRGNVPHPAHVRGKSRQTGLNSRYARRFLTLIDWIMEHEARDSTRSPNDAARVLRERPEYKYANAADNDPLPDFLTDAQVERLIDFLTRAAGHHADPEPAKWNRVRNLTSVALMLGAGLTPGDVRHLTLDGILFDGGRDGGAPTSLCLPGNGNFPSRETPLAAWAAPALAHWLQVREAHDIPGPFVFPGRRNGVQWSDTRAYEMMRDVLIEAGIAGGKGGVFKLRHTFALRHLAQGEDEKDVARWLGLLDINGMARYRRVLWPTPDPE